MNSHYRVVVIGGGVVGTSVLYHLAKFGWTDVCLLERSILTAGSSWHAAGGFHALNADPNMASLQAYTIDLLSEVEKESGQNIGMHMTGGLTLAGTPERWEWLQSAYRTFQSIGIDDCELLSPEEAQKRCPIMSTDGVLGAMIISWILFKKPDASMALNGALAGRCGEAGRNSDAGHGSEA